MASHIDSHYSNIFNKEQYNTSLAHTKFFAKSETFFKIPRTLI